MCNPIKFRKMEKNATDDHFEATVLISKRSRVIQNNRFMKSQENKSMRGDDDEEFVEKLSLEELDAINKIPKSTSAAINNLLEGEISPKE